ncbi:MAG: capsular polysaccharide biosynthesis protein CapF [Oscillospiraceae bacterium]|nr:capsular polysaccharide biosynthesis protein CapF [Oscillospiraceae bacterium]
MKILVTGAKGFVGQNLCLTLENIANGCDKTRGIDPDLTVYRYDLDTAPGLLQQWCKDCDFVFHLAGVNRPKEVSEFMEGNFGFTNTLLEALEAAGNTCPIMISSSIQAALDNPYGKSKLAGEELLRQYGERRGAKVLIYRLPNLFGKWCRPNYNSVTATFCHNIANGLPIQVNDPSVELRLVYIDDLVAELLEALKGCEHREGDFCIVPIEHRITLGRLAETIQSFRTSREDRTVAKVGDPLEAKLYATYLSYLPKEAFSYPLKMNVDHRGSFTEIIRTAERGQFSVNISKPGITKGNHWHHSKNEKFLVVSGKGVIRFRHALGGEIQEYFVSGEKLEVVDIPTGYTHNIENLGDTDMVTFMWASECFDPNKPDTYFLEV